MNAKARPIDLSIVICTRNRASKLSAMLDALAGIRSGHDWDVLIVDNASTDDTAAVLAAADNLGGRLRTAHASQVGLGAARDFAWRQTTGALVAFTDDDCYVAPDYVDALIAAFADHPDVAAVGGRILLFDPADYPVTIDERETPCEQEPYRFVAPGTLAGANMAVRRTALAAIDGFDPDLGAGTPFPCEDIDVVAALAWAGMRTRYDPAPLVHHHHGRRQDDVPALMRSYDRGRGAYFAKYLLRGNSRRAYLDGWLAVTFNGLHRGSLRQFGRELAAAQRYIGHRRRYGFLAVFTLGGGLVLAFAAAAVVAAKLARLVRGAVQQRPIEPLLIREPEQ